jgi:hypothetical protein
MFVSKWQQKWRFIFNPVLLSTKYTILLLSPYIDPSLIFKGKTQGEATEKAVSDKFTSLLHYGVD